MVRSLGLAAAAAIALCSGIASSDEHLYWLAVRARLEGQVQTVLGPVAPESLGFTLMHEHLFVDFFPQFVWPRQPADMPPALFRKMQETGWTIPTTPAEREFFARHDLTLAMVNDMRRGWRSRSNLQIDREPEVAAEVMAYKRAGGETIVDVTPIGLGRNGPRLQNFARRHDLRIVMGTGWYRWPFHPSGVHDLSVDALTERMVLDVLEGDATRHVKAGIIGEIPLDSRSMRFRDEGIGAISNDVIADRIGAAERRLGALPVADRDRIPLGEVYDEQEIKVLRAAARASRITGAALTLHAREPWLGYLTLLQEEGVPPSRTIIGHAHAHFIERDLLLRALRAGVVLEADYMLQQYATKAPLGPLNDILDGVVWAIRNGYRDQVLLSLDLCNKLGQQRYGGGGYTTLQDYVFPYLRRTGVTEDDIRHVMIENPQRLLAFVAPQRALHARAPP
jgi:phosphotriesterase-related protein